ncbi:hypothetical protein BTR14_09420 [Rhizobium rhizosphaerae]|uniref:Uncharacterized protein n=1 Tax=Xaviernesmea rhizosphaerae TaxID=1672749 RepID=A0ABX3PEZ2_9HYPH|nr:hypothetical protein [Xaviernesmea rhizosphaerae]OQP86656.1 hypothetical protein BTR14_09420 [Xaviernesmea rhizosphaerae]
MIDWPAGADAKQPHVLIMDTTPLSVLAIIEGLDWLFAPGCPVMITDMVLAEATRDPGEGRDLRRRTRTYVAQWLEQNRHRITILSTVDGERYGVRCSCGKRRGSRRSFALTGATGAREACSQPSRT